MNVRAAVLAALGRLYLPVAADDLVLVTRLAEGVRIGEGALTELAEADRAGFAAGVERPVWICPALEYPDGTPAAEFFTRSDWPVWARTVRGVLSESQELWLLRSFCDLAAGTSEDELLRERIEDLTVHLPESRLAERRDEGTDTLSVYRELAEDIHGELVRQERVAQRHVVEALERLPLPEKYFGVR